MGKASKPEQAKMIIHKQILTAGVQASQKKHWEATVDKTRQVRGAQRTHFMNAVPCEMKITALKWEPALKQDIELQATALQWEPAPSRDVGLERHRTTVGTPHYRGVFEI